MSNALHNGIRNGCGLFLALAALTLLTLCLAPRANAESVLYSNPETNVFLRYGVGPVLGSEGYTNLTQIYHGCMSFENTKLTTYGELAVFNGKVHLRLAKNEKITGTENRYKFSDGSEAEEHWGGKYPLPTHIKVGAQTGTLVYVNVGVHSPKLPDQPPEPKYEGMH